MSGPWEEFGGQGEVAPWEDFKEEGPAVSKEYAYKTPTEEPQLAAHRTAGQSLWALAAPERNAIAERTKGGLLDRFGDQLFSFLETAKHPIEAMREDSIAANVMKAKEKGVFDKPLSELVQKGKEAIHEWSVKDLWDAAKGDPGKFLGVLTNSLMADPALLLAPVGLGGRVAAGLGQVAGKAGALAGRVAETGAMGGALTVPVSGAQQLAEKGSIDPRQLGEEVKGGAALGAALGTALHLPSDLTTKWGKISPEQVLKRAEFHVGEGETPMEAVLKGLKEHGLDDETMAAMREGAELPYRDEAAVEKADALERAAKGQTTDLGEPSSLQARADFLMKKKTLTPEQAKELVDIKTYQEALPELGVEPEVAAKMAPEEAKAVVQERLPEASLETFVKVEGPRVLEESSTSGKGKETFETKDGREVRFQHSSDAEGNSLITALDNNGQEVGKMSFSTKEDAEGVRLNPSVEVEKGWQRQGIASKMYDLAEEAGGKIPSADVQGEFRSEAGAAFRAARERSQTLGPGWKERGVMDPEMAKWLAVGGAGAALGGYLSEDKMTGALGGAALGLAGMGAIGGIRKALAEGKVKLKQAQEKFHSLQRDPAIARQIDEMLSAHEAITASVGLASDRLSYAIKKLVPDAARRGELIHAIQEGRVKELRGEERTAAELFQKEMVEFGEAGQKAGVLDDLISDGTYVAQLWKNPRQAQALFSNISGKTRHAHERIIPSYKEGIALGLEPQTLDLAEITQIYGRAIGKAIANKELLKTLKGSVVKGTEKFSADKAVALKISRTKRTHLEAEQLPETVAPVMESAEAPADYVALPHSQLQGFRVHPEMAPSLSFLFHSNNIPTYLKAASAVSATAKQGLLGLSAFHAKSLLEVGLGIAIGLGSPKTLTKIPEMYRMLRYGEAGDFVDRAVRSGLEIGAHGFDMEAGAFAKLANGAVDRLEKMPGGKLISLPIKGIQRLAEANNYFLWQYLHPSIKLATTNLAYSKALEKQAALLAKNPSAKIPSPTQTLREIASAANDLFGGVNWRQVSGEIENKFMHSLAASMTNPEGLRYLRVGLLAPDWLASTVRAGYKGMKATAKSILPGPSLSVSEDIYRRYFLGGALMTAALMEGLQQALTGTHFWENDDPTQVYFPDGRHMQVAKHFNEIFHWMKDPAGTFVNKLGYVPKEAATQLGSKEYISTKHSPPMEGLTDNWLTNAPVRAGHAAKGMLPIMAQELLSGKLTEAATGALGIPIHGKEGESGTFEQKRRMKEMHELLGESEAKALRKQMRKELQEMLKK